jgi:hypothetical protein
MRLSKGQIKYFNDFGFLRFDGLLSDKIDDIVEGFERVWRDYGGGHGGRTHDQERRSALLPFIDRDAYMSTLIDDARINGIASSILGDDYNYTSSDGNYYVGDTPWHSDGYMNKKYMSVKMGFYLDPVAPETGCLRVIPGSHKVGDVFAESLEVAAPNSKSNVIEDTWAIHGSQLPAFALPVKPGDLLMFNHATKHASFGGGIRRRMFTINLEQRHADEDLQAIRDDLAGNSRFWYDKAYGDVMVETANPARMVHLEQRLANDDHLPELVRKAREEMDEPSRG